MSENRMKTHFEPFPSEYNYRAMVTDDGHEENIFRFHVQEGLLRPRMSALELCEFVEKHIRSMLQQQVLDAMFQRAIEEFPALMTKFNRIKAEFEALYMKIVLTPKADLDQLLPWIRVEWGRDKIKYPTGDLLLEPSEGSDTIYLNLFDKRPLPAGPSYFGTGDAPNIKRNAELATQKELEGLLAKTKLERELDEYDRNLEPRCPPSERLPGPGWGDMDTPKEKIIIP